ncbi:ligand-binding sensor domain-containing protein [Paraflavitalea speifideaquila]|uniref:ligand-binding sensor domain-containing protein n=1 Tax=Paraflavitalea speifideaquila TaxID=3076558 RepID=UPI0028F060A9|nr:two-component regulator propeller domain-containing protein [Paraflavitalea speifideiaquila]
MDSKGNIFLIITRLGILAYDWKTNTFSKDESRIRTPRGWSIGQLLEDPQTGHYWMGADSGLAQYDFRTKSLSYYGHNTSQQPILDNPLFKEPVTVMFIDRQLRFWLTTWNPKASEKFYCVDKATGRMTSDTAGLMVHPAVYKELHAFTQQSNGAIWSYGERLLMEFDTLTKKFQYIRNDYVDDYDIKYDMVYCMYEDREQNTWIGTDEGVYIFNPARQMFNSIVLQGSLPGNANRNLQVNAFLQRNNNELIIASWGLGAITCDSNFLPLKNDMLKGSPAGDDNYAMQWDLHEEKSTGRLWIACQEGRFILYNPLTRQSTFHKLPLAGQRTIRQITEDKQGTIWLATQYGHIVKWDPAAGYGKDFMQGFSQVQNINTIVYKMMVDKEGFLWLCTHMKGVYKMDPRTGEILAHYDSKGGPGKSLYSDMAGDILQYNDSLFFICSGALNLLNQKAGTIQPITTDEGLPSMSASSLEMDNDNNLWVGLADGICRYNQNERYLPCLPKRWYHLRQL